MMRMTIMMLMSMMMDDNDENENIDYLLMHVDDEHRTLI